MLQRKEFCSFGNVNLKLNKSEIHEKETEGKMMVKLSNGESTKVTVGNLQESTDVTDNGTKMDVREPVAMASTLIETVSLINEATRSTISPNDDDTMGKNDPTQNVQQSLSQFCNRRYRIKNK